MFWERSRIQTALNLGVGLRQGTEHKNDTLDFPNGQRSKNFTDYPDYTDKLESAQWSIVKKVIL